MVTLYSKRLFVGEDHHFLLRDAVYSGICESLRSLAHSNCVNFNQTDLRAVLKPDWKHIIVTSKTNIRTLCRLCVPSSTLCRLCQPFKYISFHRRFQSFQSLLGLLFMLVSVAV